MRTLPQSQEGYSLKKKKKSCSKGYTYTFAGQDLILTSIDPGKSALETFLLTSADNLEVDFADQIGHPARCAPLEWNFVRALPSRHKAEPAFFLSRARARALAKSGSFIPPFRAPHDPEKGELSDKGSVHSDEIAFYRLRAPRTKRVLSRSRVVCRSKLICACRYNAIPRARVPRERKSDPSKSARNTSDLMSCCHRGRDMLPNSTCGDWRQNCERSERASGSSLE